MKLGSGARKRLATLLATMLGEPDDLAADVASSFDDYLGRVPFLTAFGLRLMIWALTWLPLVFVGRPLPVSALAVDTRERYLARWAGSHVYYVREGFFLVKMVALLGWGAHPTVRARFDMPPVAAPRGAPSSSAPSEVAA